MDRDAVIAALEWQIALGADEAICDTPIDRYAAERAAVEAASTPASASRAAPGTGAPARNTPPRNAPPHDASPHDAPARDGSRPAMRETAPGPYGAVPLPGAASPMEVACALAAGAATLDELRLAIAGFEGSDLRLGARNLVFADGLPGARVMIVGDAPGREDDREGRPFAGPEGRMLDAMFGAIGLSRTAPDGDHALHVAPVLPWRLPQDRHPTDDEIALFLPFLRRHIDLAAPEIVVALGNHACQALLGQRGVTRLRGAWTTRDGLEILPMAGPDHLLRYPLAKRDAWADLLSLQARLAA